MSPSDHHTAYLARAVAELTPEGRARVDELLDQLAEAAGGREWLTRSFRSNKSTVTTSSCQPFADCLLDTFEGVREGALATKTRGQCDGLDPGVGVVIHVAYNRKYRNTDLRGQLDDTTDDLAVE